MREDARKYNTWIIISVIIVLGWVISSLVITKGIIAFKESQSSIEVAGCAKKQIKSDYVTWSGSFSAQSPKMSEAYAVMKTSEEKVKKYLVEKGIKEKDIILSSINMSTNYVRLSNGTQTSQIESYSLSQNLEIGSSDIEKITDISRKATELINQGVEFQSYPPEYYYTKIADLKIDMLSLATKDAKLRAEKIAEFTGTKIGRLKSANMGVFQITPLYSTEVSDLGIFDTSSIDKEITAVVVCQFEIK